jgi:hypothetical protein
LNNVLEPSAKVIIWPLNVVTCSRVLITSAGVTNEAAGTPAMAPAVSSDSGELYPFSSARAALL